MIKHRNKSHDSGTKEEKKISSAEEFKEHVGRVSERVKESYGQDNSRHKQPESPGAKEFVEKVGRTSDRLVKAAAAAVFILSVVDIHYLIMQEPALTREQQSIVVANKIRSLREKKHQAVGESATRGLPTNRTVAEVNVNRIIGNSYKKENGRLYELENSWSVQLNVNLGILTENKKDGAKRLEVLWLQDVFSSYKGKATITSEIYHGIVRIENEKFGRERVLNDDWMLPWRTYGNVAKDEAKPVDVLHGITGKGKIVKDSSRLGNDTYLYNKDIGTSTKSVHIALDIKEAVKNPHEVEISFGYAPIEKGGKVDWKKEEVFDNVTYHVKGTVVNAKIGFSKIYDAGLTIDGFSNGEFLYVQKLSGNLGLYEAENGKLKPLKISGFTDYSTAEWTYDVKSVVIHKGVVNLGVNKGNSEKLIPE